MLSDDQIMELALCPCGHAIPRHDAKGCPGARATFCMCTLTPDQALDAAIERVRDANRASRRPSRVIPFRRTLRASARQTLQ